MSVDWFKWLKHESDFADLPRVSKGVIPTPEDHPDNWDELDFQADVMELYELVEQVVAAGPRAVDVNDAYSGDWFWDWNRRRSILQFAADTQLTATFQWLEPRSFQELWDAA